MTHGLFILPHSSEPCGVGGSSLKDPRDQQTRRGGIILAEINGPWLSGKKATWWQGETAMRLGKAAKHILVFFLQM